jgi:Flp pilus assembly pilin Flp
MTKYLVALHSRLVALRIRNETGQTLVEYGLILTLVVLLAIADLTVFGNDVNGFLKDAGEKI